MALAAFTTFNFPYHGQTWNVYKQGSGPGVLVLSEIPGITPQVIAFAERIVQEGFTVWMPHLFGDDGREASTGYVLATIARVCVRREFAALASHQTGSICEPLRAMCRQLKAEAGGKGVGAVGMCFTGNFALAMMLEDAVLAPVLSQPSLPFSLTGDGKADVHLSPDDFAACKKRAADTGIRPIALRFTKDKRVPGERFETLRREFNAETIEIDSSPGNQFGIPESAHSVLTNDLVDEAGHPTRQALDRVLSFLRLQLQ